MPGEKATDQSQILDLRSQNSLLQHDNADMCPIFFLKNHSTLLDTSYPHFWNTGGPQKVGSVDKDWSHETHPFLGRVINHDA